MNLLFSYTRVDRYSAVGVPSGDRSSPVGGGASVAPVVAGAVAKVDPAFKPGAPLVAGAAASLVEKVEAAFKPRDADLGSTIYTQTL